MTRTTEELVALLRAAVLGVPLPEGFAPRDYGALFRLAARQDLGHLLYDVLEEAGLLPEGRFVRPSAVNASAPCGDTAASPMRGSGSPPRFVRQGSGICP